MVPCVIRYECDYYELDESQIDELVVCSSQIEICIMDVQMQVIFQFKYVTNHQVYYVHLQFVHFNYNCR